MKAKLYSYKNCSTCKKAIKFLEKKDINVEIIDITVTPPTKSEIKAMIKRYDGNVKKLFNTSGQVYRELGLSNKLPTMTESAAIDLLAKNGKLVKRPFLLRNKVAETVGFKEEEWSAILSG